MGRLLILFDSRGGLTQELAGAVAEGASSVPGTEVLTRSLEEARPREMEQADGIILGSPNYSGITARLKEFFDRQGDRWESGWLAGKVGAAFTAGWSPHGGMEATLGQLLHLLLAHGLLIVGLPWSAAMRAAGSYYGATACGHVREEDREQGRALGRRVAEVVSLLVAGREALSAGGSPPELRRV